MEKWLAKERQLLDDHGEKRKLDSKQRLEKIEKIRSEIKEIGKENDKDLKTLKTLKRKIAQIIKDSEETNVKKADEDTKQTDKKEQPKTIFLPLKINKKWYDVASIPSGITKMVYSGAETYAIGHNSNHTVNITYHGRWASISNKITHGTYLNATVNGVTTGNVLPDRLPKFNSFV
jgi:hypothetical protein